MVRLRVADVEAWPSWARWRRPGPPSWPTPASRAHRQAWRWPVRVGVGAAAADPRCRRRRPGRGRGGGGRRGRVVRDPGARRGGRRRPRRACGRRASWSWARHIADVDPSVVDRFDAAAVVVSPGADGSWLATAVRHLACGRPLDVAVGLAVPGGGDRRRRRVPGADVGPGVRPRSWWSSSGGSTPPGRPTPWPTWNGCWSPFDADGRAGAELAAVVHVGGRRPGWVELTTVEHLRRMRNGGGHRRQAPRRRPPPPPGDGADEAVGIGADEVAANGHAGADARGRRPPPATTSTAAVTRRRRRPRPTTGGSRPRSSTRRPRRCSTTGSSPARTR